MSIWSHTVAQFRQHFCCRHPHILVILDKQNGLRAPYDRASACSARLFVRDDGDAWGKSEAQRPMAVACNAARIDPEANFHGLRHTYASRLAMKGVPFAVIAAQLGHSHTRMIEKHYGHLAPSYVADTVRAAFDSLGIVVPANVIPLAI